MPDPTPALTPVLLLKAMDGLSLRAEATAQNIANANTPGYRPLTVSFEDALRDAVRQGVQAVEDVRPRILSAFDSAGSAEMRLDLELVTASATAGRYARLAELLNRQLQLQALAASGIR